MDERNRFFTGLLNGIAGSLILLAAIYFIPRIIIGLSDQLIAWGASEVWLAFGTGIGIGITLGVIGYATVQHYANRGDSSI